MPDQTKPDLPETTKDTANSMVDAATDLALDSTISAPIRRNALKAFDRLCSALIDVPVGALERRSAEKRSESEARIKVMEEITDQILQQIKVDPEYALKAGHKFAEKIIREQLNLDNISAIAANELNKDESNNSPDQNRGESNEQQPAGSTNQDANSSEEKTINDVWLNIFETEARPQSAEEGQLLFARILAGEIRNPGSYSIPTLKTLGELDQDTAASFKKLCSMCIAFERGVDSSVLDARVPTLDRSPEQNAFSKYGLDVKELNGLNEYGLTISSHAPLFPYNLCIGIEGTPEPLPFQHQRQNWVL